MAEEIFKICVFCKREFNFEWGGHRFGEIGNRIYVCTLEFCQKTADDIIRPKKEKKTNKK